jgi:hypothetical protein
MFGNITGLENVGMPLSFFIVVLVAAFTAGIFLIIHMFKNQ